MAFRNLSAIDPERRLEKESPISLLKACKNEVELAAMRDCHLRDGAAVVEFLCWLDDQLCSDKDSDTDTISGKTKHTGPSTVKISEVELADQLASFRARCDKFLYPSFETIAGVNENGAIIHYRYGDFCFIHIYFENLHYYELLMLLERRRVNASISPPGICFCWIRADSILMVLQVSQ